MKKIKKTISGHLASWGKTNQQIPPRNEVLKNEILDKAQIPIMKIARAHRPMPWTSFALTAAALLVLFISPKITRQNSAPSGLPEAYYENAKKSPDSKSMPPPKEPLSGAIPGGFLGETTTNQNKFSVPLSQAAGRLPEKEKALRYRYDADLHAESSLIITSIEDTREFLKTTYGGYARCRHIGEFSQRIQVSIRGYGGRVDSSSSSERYGYINFAVPADKFDAFKNEMRNLFGERFYSEHIQTENLLPQKQSIESQQQDTQKNLDRLRMDRNRLKKSHEHKAASIKSEMDAVTAEIENLKAEVTDDWNRRIFLANRIRELQKNIWELNARLRNENDSYYSNLYAYNHQIRGSEDNLVNLGKQDKNLLKTVATVRGSITLSWIDIWEIIDAYIPVYWFAIFLFALAVVFFFIHRRKNRLLTI